jgi:hypothetical protein
MMELIHALLCAGLVFLMWTNYILWQLAMARWNEGVNDRARDTNKEVVEKYWQDQDC